LQKVLKGSASTLVSTCNSKVVWWNKVNSKNYV
jgi:hypothetical protein